MNRVAAAFLLALSISACASTPDKPESAERESLVTRNAVVESVNMQSRQVLLRREDGTMLSIIAGPEVRNLAQLEAGDVVQIAYYEAVSVKMADPSADNSPDALVVTGRAPQGAKPGVAAGATVRMVVDFISYNTDTAVATFRTPDGTVEAAQVKPELRAFAAGLTEGDKVDLTMTEAVAVEIIETN